MTDPRLEDHVVGLELQLVELVERRKEAQGFVGGQDDVARLEAEIAELQAELAASAELLVGDHRPEPEPAAASEAILSPPDPGGGADPVQPPAQANL